MSDFKIETIFPKTIIMANIDRSISQEELNVVNFNSNHTYLNTGNVTSVNRNILDNDLPQIKNFIYSGIKEYVDKVLMPKTDLQFFITQSWLNYTKPGQFHHKHKHPNSIISGVFYFNANPDVDKIYFFDNNDPQIKIIPKEWNWYNSPSWYFSVKTGDLILFSSDLVHMVDTTVGNDVRISLAFNVFAKGSFGSEQELTSLNL